MDQVLSSTALNTHFEKLIYLKSKFVPDMVIWSSKTKMVKNKKWLGMNEV